MKKFILYVGLIAITLTACQSKPQSTTPVGMTEEEYQEYKDLLASVQTIEQSLEDVTAMTAEQALQLSNLNSQFHYDYDPMGKDSATIAGCEHLKKRIQSLHHSIDKTIQQCLPTIRINALDKSDYLVEKTETFPIYLKRGDSLFIHVRTERVSILKVHNADAKSTLLTRTNRNQYDEKVAISNSAIYLVEIIPGNAQYADIQLSYTPGSIERIANPVEVRSEEVEAQAGDWRVRTVKGLKMKNLFEEPRKFTLRGQLKAAFSGSYRALVAVQVPAGATDILYSLRISTNESNTYKDGKFHDNMETSYKRVKMLGLPVYESHKGGGLIATLLGENLPVREEDAYINMYVFYNAALAKKFQDGADPAKLAYNVDYSTLGTQSCNGRIPSKGNKTIYLAFENERMRYNNYIWLEAVSAVPNTEYFKTKYSVK